jgi:serine/threonine-protein kinase
LSSTVVDDDLYAQFEALLALSAGAQQARLQALRQHNPQQSEQLQRLLEHDAHFQAAAERGHTLSWAAHGPAPEVIGKFSLLAPVAAGGMGRVYRAVRTNGDDTRVYALKLIRRDLLSEPLRQRFALECEALASLQHPGIARFVESGQGADGTPFVVMEYIEGEPIDQWCDRQQMNLGRRIQLLCELADAVTHAHTHLFVHRDIKAANVLVDARGKVTLVDFGIAKSLADPLQKATQTSDRFLSPLSAAPEQILGTPVGTGCDVYGLGLLAYRLLCGREPFEWVDADPVALQRQILWQPAPDMCQRLLGADAELARQRGLADIKSLQDALRGDLSQVILRCLRKQPAERYAGVVQFEQDLRRILAGQPISGRESERWYRARKFIQRNRVAVSVVAASLLLLVGALMWSLQQERRAVHERDRAESAVGLLKQAFAAANPMQIEGGNISVRQVLDAAEPLMEARRQAQPELYADLAATLAEVELHTGRPQQALALADKAISAGGHAGLAAGAMQTLYLLAAKAALRVGQLSEMEHRLSKLHPVTVDDQIEQWLLRSGLATLRGDFAQAEDLLNRAYVVIKPRPGDDSQAINVREQLAQVYQLQGNRERALSLTEEALTVQARYFAAEHPRMLLTRLRWLNYRVSLRPPAEMLPEVQALHAQIEQVFGANSVPLARVLGLLARVHLALGEDAQGTQYFREQLRVSEIATSSGSSNTLRTRFNLALMLSETGKDDIEAEQHFRLLLSEASADNQLAAGIWRFWRVKYLEFLTQRRRCDESLAQAEQYFPPEDDLAMDVRNQHLLREVLGQALQQCACAGDPTAHRCAAAQVLQNRLPPTG